MGKMIKLGDKIETMIEVVQNPNATETNIKLYENGKRIVLTVTGNETEDEINSILQCNAIIVKLYEICSDLNLDFRDFKLAFREDPFFSGENSFNRILNNGLPKKYIRNPEILRRFLNAIETTLKKCADKTYKLKYSDFESFKKQYEQQEEKGRKITNRLYASAITAIRVDPELSKKEDKSLECLQQDKCAKYFFEGIEQDNFEKIKEPDWCYYKIPAPLCHQMYEALKRDKTIMDHLQEIFKRADEHNYWPFG